MPTPSSDVQLAQQIERLQRPDGAGDPADATDTLRFRAPTLEGAIALAETSLGSRVRVVAANRIRRGGIGGFFASDLGVEVTVALDDETMEDALARLVAESDADERAQWTSSTRATPVAELGGISEVERGRATGGVEGAADAHALLESFAAIAARAGAIDDVRLASDGPSGMPAPSGMSDDREPRAVNPVLAEVLAAIMAEASHAHSAIDEPEYTPEPTPPLVARRSPGAPSVPLAPLGAVEHNTGRRPVYATPPTMMRVEQIIEELSAITAAPVFSAERSQPRVPRQRFGDRLGSSAPRASEPTEIERPIARPKVLPTLPPRASEIARAASAASAASHARLLLSPERPTAPVERGEPDAPGIPVEPIQRLVPETEPATGRDLTAPADTSAESSTQSPGRLPARSPAVLVVDDEDVLDGTVEAGGPQSDGAAGRRLQMPARHSATSVTGNGAPSTQAPSRRHVELAVAATDQLIESLKREDGVKRLSVRVVLRTGDHREVEAEAEWEAE